MVWSAPLCSATSRILALEWNPALVCPQGYCCTLDEQSILAVRSDSPCRCRPSLTDRRCNSKPVQQLLVFVHDRSLRPAVIELRQLLACKTLAWVSQVEAGSARPRIAFQVFHNLPATELVPAVVDQGGPCLSGWTYPREPLGAGACLLPPPAARSDGSVTAAPIEGPAKLPAGLQKGLQTSCPRE